MADIPVHKAIKRLGPYAMQNWPVGIPYPSDADIDAAEKRMHDEADAMYKHGYQGDWGMNLPFLMATYSQECWWHLFKPDGENYQDKLDHILARAMQKATHG